jgi:hypothetical protein
MAMGSSLSPIVNSIFMEHLEKLALDTAQYKPSLWLRYVDDIVVFVVWPQGPEQLQKFLSHFNSLRPSIQFTTVVWKGMTLATKIYRTPTNTGRYLNFKSNHPPHVKKV